MFRDPRSDGGDFSSTPARAKQLAPRPDGPLTHFASPRGEKGRLALAGCNIPVSTVAAPAVDCADWNSKEYFQAAVEDVTACLASGANPKARDLGA